MSLELDINEDLTNRLRAGQLPLQLISCRRRRLLVSLLLLLLMMMMTMRVMRMMMLVTMRLIAKRPSRCQMKYLDPARAPAA